MKSDPRFSYTHQTAIVYGFVTRTRRILNSEKIFLEWKELDENGGSLTDSGRVGGGLTQPYFRLCLGTCVNICVCVVGRDLNQLKMIA